MQEQVYPPSVLMQICVGLHWWESVAHSSTSVMRHISGSVTYIYLEPPRCQLLACLLAGSGSCPWVIAKKTMQLLAEHH